MNLFIKRNSLPSGKAAGWGTLKKLLVIMKLMSVFLFAACFYASATGTAQKVTLKEKNATLEKIFKEINRQTGFYFLYNSDLLRSAKKITIEVKEAPLTDVLEYCFREQPLAFIIHENTILVKEKQAIAVKNIIEETPPPPPPPIDIRGRVLNENSEPVIVSVMIKGTNIGTSTNAEGYFELKGINDNAILVVTASNIETREIAVRGRSDLSVISVKMKVASLDEVQIIAYGTTTRRLSTSNISSVKGEVLSKSPVLNPLQALQGRVPGITIESSSGLPGAYVNVRIQGQNSLARGNNPLYIVDGIPYPSNNLYNRNGGLYDPNGQGKNGTDNYGEGVQPGSPLNYINMNDIASIEILKDADATAIYGSRGANGVILITTKKGKAGPLRLDLNLQQGMGVISKKMKMLNTQEYLEMRREAYSNDGLAVPDKNTVPEASNADLTMWNENKYTDWQEELIGGTAKYTNMYANVTGGTENANYLAGLTYRRQTSVFPGDFPTQGAGANMNMNFSSNNKRIRGGISIQYFYDNSNNPNDDLAKFVYLPPNAPDLRNPDGSINWALLPNGNSSFDNPLHYLEHRNRANTSNLITSANLGFEIISGLELKSTFGYNYMQADGLATRPLTFYSPESIPYSRRGTEVTNAYTQTWQIEPQLTYTKSIAWGRLNVLLGTTITENNQYHQYFGGLGSSNDLLLKDVSSHPDIGVYEIRAPRYKYNAGFVRINYIWRDKYIVNLNGRRDGSSRFGSENILHNFGSVAGAWIFSDEGFIKSALPFLSFGKIQASYGTIGNDNIGNYSQLSLYEKVYNVNIPYQGTIALAPVGLPNPHLQWEEIRKLSIGLDLGLFNDRLLINTIWYRNRSSNQLTGYSLPQTTGFHSIDKNFPAEIQNSGWEFTLQSINFDGKNFKWRTDANLSIQRNKLLAFPGIESTGYRDRLIVGKPLNIERYYHYLGVSPETGLYLFEDEHGNPTSEPTDAARKIYRSAFPIFTAGITNTVTYKSFQLDFVLQIVKQYGVDLKQGNLPGASPSNQPSWILDRWQKLGDNASIQKFSVTYPGVVGTAYNSYSNSDAGYGDASFVRLSNMTIGWFFPESLVKNIHLKSAKVFVLGQNLFTLTPYKGFDPEQRGGFYGFLPSIRMVTFGLQVSF